MARATANDEIDNLPWTRGSPQESDPPNLRYPRFRQASHFLPRKSPHKKYDLTCNIRAALFTPNENRCHCL